MVLEYYDVMFSFYGMFLGVKVVCKYLGWYMDEVGCDKFLCIVVLIVKILVEVLWFLFDVLGVGFERSVV